MAWRYIFSRPPPPPPVQIRSSLSEDEDLVNIFNSDETIKVFLFTVLITRTILSDNKATC